MPVHKFKVGQFDCMVLKEGTRGNDPELFTARFTSQANEDVIAALNALPEDLREWSFNPLYIDTGSHKILVDVGFGMRAPAPVFGHALESLQAEGIALADIDVIVITHTHGDHITGLLDQGGKVVFPNAQLFAWKGEWDHWMSEESLARLSPEQAADVKHMAEQMKPRLTLMDSESEILPGVSPVFLPGHTSGHIGLLVESDGECLIHLVDAAHGLLQMAHPAWSPNFDADPNVAATTRQNIFARCADENLLTLAYHFPFPALGHIVREGDAYAWKPV